MLELNSISSGEKLVDAKPRKEIRRDSPAVLFLYWIESVIDIIGHDTIDCPTSSSPETIVRE